MLLTGCYEDYFDYDLVADVQQTDSVIDSVIEIETETETETETTEEDPETIPETQDFEIPADETLPESVEKDGSYTSPEDVAEYIHTFGTLPGNFITKKEAQALGWDSSKGNLQDVAPDKSIGGDYFGNYEELLPEGNYHECDVNYTGGYRGAERIIYGDDGSIYYTNDHYQSFEQLY
ncbi:MAG: ribonuclease [Oscillospiraceae bacterium]|nr:ribonuclease [Oscillospiraceae bacterium]